MSVENLAVIRCLKTPFSQKKQSARRLFALATEIIDSQPIVINCRNWRRLQSKWTEPAKPGEPQRHYSFELHLGDNALSDDDARWFLRRISGLGHSLDLKFVWFPTKVDNASNDGHVLMTRTMHVLSAVTMTVLCQIPSVRCVNFTSAAVSKQCADDLVSRAPTLTWTAVEFVNRSKAINTFPAHERFFSMLKTMPRLRSVKWEYAGVLTDKRLQTLMSLSQLEHLSVSGCTMANATNSVTVAADSDAAPTLKTVNLSEMQLSGLHLVAVLPNLEKMFLAGNNLDAASLAGLRRYGKMIIYV